MLLEIKVDEQEFIDHVKRVCKRNIKNGAKICTKCPFQKEVVRCLTKLLKEH